MDMYTATEEAYKKGYEAGKRDAINKLKKGFCPICESRHYIISDDVMIHCPICGHHVVLHDMEVIING